MDSGNCHNEGQELSTSLCVLYLWSRPFVLLQPISRFHSRLSQSLSLSSLSSFTDGLNETLEVAWMSICNFNF